MTVGNSAYNVGGGGGGGIVLPSDIATVGYIDYNDTGTSITPIIVSAGVPTDITNDNLGPFGISTFKPVTRPVTELWNTTTQSFDYSKLNEGDTVDIRLVVDVTTTTANTEVSIDLMSGIGGFPFPTQWVVPVNYKTAGLQPLSGWNSIHMANANMLTNQSRFVINSDKNCTVVVLGFYIRVLSQGL